MVDGLIWNIKRNHRVAVAGLGGIAQGCHLPSYRKLGPQLGIDVVGGAEPDAVRRERVAVDYGIPVFDSVGEMLDEVEPEVVDVTVPPGDARAEVIKQCVQAGCHVMSQKPLAYSLQQATEIVEAAEEAGRLFSVNVQARYAPAFYAVRRVIASGRIGDVVSVSINSTFPLGGDMSVDMAIHEMDLVRYWTGLDPVSVQATLRELNGSRSLIVIQADLGDAVAMIVEENHAPAVRPWSFRVCGTEALLEGHDQFGSVEPAVLMLYRQGDEPETIDIPDYPYVTDAFAHVLAALLEAIETGAEPPTSGRDHLRSLGGCLAARASITSGRPEDVPLREMA